MSLYNLIYLLTYFPKIDLLKDLFIPIDTNSNKSIPLIFSVLLTPKKNCFSYFVYSVWKKDNPGIIQIYD